MRAFLLALCLMTSPASAAEALIAVATNFAGAAEALAADFGTSTGHRIAFSVGATGKLYAQVSAGAPFDAFLSADSMTPERLEADGLGIAGTRFSYATGTLTLWSPDPARDLSDPGAALRSATHIAVANPELAPYGRAAMESLDHLGLKETVADRIVTAENVGQAYALVATGAAELGLVARSSVLAGDVRGSGWDVPPDHHAPILQAATLLRHGKDNPAASEFLAYLASDAALPTLAAHGYGPVK